MTTLTAYVASVAAALEQRYQDVVELGQGRSGIVFSARTSGEEGNAEAKTVAIKVAYPVERETDLPGSVVRFRREAEVGAELRHENILRISPIEHLGSFDMFEMDMAGSYRLDHVVLGEPAPGFERVVAIMRQVADAVDYAHSIGVLHGALRPTNVLLDPSGNVLVKGFLLRENVVASHPALAPGAVGDPAYMPPEQWHVPTVDRRVDVYSAGVLAYELCTGARRVSYEVPGVPEIRPMELAPNRALRHGMPLHVNAAIRKATAKDPAVRYASVGEFVQALAEPDLALGHSLPTLLPPARKERGSHWILLLLVMGAAVVGFSVPSEPRDMVVGWGISLLSWSMGDIDPWPASNGSRGGGSGSGSSTRGAGSTTRDATGNATVPTRDTTTSRSEPQSREESSRGESDLGGSTRGEVSPLRTESPRQESATGSSNGAPAPGEESSRRGVLKISVDQGRALVLVDGIPRGFAPVSVSASPGDHRVSVRGTLTYDPRDMRLKVPAGDTAFAEFYATNAPLDTMTLGDRAPVRSAFRATNAP